MTLGQLRIRLVKAFPGTDLDLLDGWISDAYQDILSELPWSRLNVSSILQTTAPYETGTIALVSGSASLTLTSGTWVTGMTGRAFRATGRDEFYEFTYVSATTGTLDRVYEGSTDSAATYSIFQHVYPLPADCRHLDDDAFSTFTLGPFARLHRNQLDAIYPDRSISGTPEVWAAYMDDSSDPPRMQIEILPVPDEAIGIPFSYVAEADSPTSTGATLLPWIQPTALIEKVSSSICVHLENLPKAAFHERRADAALSRMKNIEALRTGPVVMEIDDYYTSHRQRRACR